MSLIHVNRHVESDLKDSLRLLYEQFIDRHRPPADPLFMGVAQESLENDPVGLDAIGSIKDRCLDRHVKHDREDTCMIPIGLLDGQAITEKTDDAVAVLTVPHATSAIRPASRASAPSPIPLR